MISWYLDYFVVLLSDFSVKWIFVFLLFLTEFRFVILVICICTLHYRKSMRFYWVDFSSFNFSGASNLLLLHFFPNWYKDGRKFWGFDMKWKLLQCLICFESNRISDEWWSLPIENGTWGCCFMVITKNWNFLIRMANS